MENVLGNIVAYWVVTQVWLTGALGVAWLGWAFTRLVRSK